jgi:hypothetical protein
MDGRNWGRRRCAWAATVSGGGAWADRSLAGQLIKKPEDGELVLGGRNTFSRLHTGRWRMR